MTVQTVGDSFLCCYIRLPKLIQNAGHLLVLTIIEIIWAKLMQKT